jgi:hypothetical protein
MLANIIVAISNFPSVYQILISNNKKDYLTTPCIGFVAVFSFLSHLVENHKHGMNGIGLSTNFSYILNRFDVLGCFLVTARFLYIYLLRYGLSFNVFVAHKKILIYAIISLILNVISEFDKYNPTLKSLYLIIHCA